MFVRDLVIGKLPAFSGTGCAREAREAGEAEKRALSRFAESVEEPSHD